MSLSIARLAGIDGVPLRLDARAPDRFCEVVRALEPSFAGIVAAGRFDGLKHCNNVLAFPGLMRGAMEMRARRILLPICLADARAIAAHPKGGDTAEASDRRSPFHSRHRLSI